MTGSIQVSKGKYYMVFNIYENGKRKQKWVATGLSEKGNKKKAQEMLYQKLANWEKDNSLDVISSDILFSEAGYLLHCPERRRSTGHPFGLALPQWYRPGWKTLRHWI